MRRLPLWSSVYTICSAVYCAMLWLELTGASVYFENLSSHILEKCNALPGSSKLKVRKVPRGLH